MDLYLTTPKGQQPCPSVSDLTESEAGFWHHAADIATAQAQFDARARRRRNNGHDMFPEDPADRIDLIGQAVEEEECDGNEIDHELKEKLMKEESFRLRQNRLNMFGCLSTPRENHSEGNKRNNGEASKGKFLPLKDAAEGGSPGAGATETQPERLGIATSLQKWSSSQRWERRKRAGAPTTSEEQKEENPYAPTGQKWTRKKPVAVDEEEQSTRDEGRKDGKTASLSTESRRGQSSGGQKWSKTKPNAAEGEWQEIPLASMNGEFHESSAVAEAATSRGLSEDENKGGPSPGEKRGDAERGSAAHKEQEEEQRLRRRTNKASPSKSGRDVSTPVNRGGASDSEDRSRATKSTTTKKKKKKADESVFFGEERSGVTKVDGTPRLRAEDDVSSAPSRVSSRSKARRRRRATSASASASVSSSHERSRRRRTSVAAADTSQSTRSERTSRVDRDQRRAELNDEADKSHSKKSSASSSFRHGELDDEDGGRTKSVDASIQLKENGENDDDEKADPLKVKNGMVFYNVSAVDRIEELDNDGSPKIKSSGEVIEGKPSPMKGSMEAEEDMKAEEEPEDETNRWVEDESEVEDETVAEKQTKLVSEGKEEPEDDEHIRALRSEGRTGEGNGSETNNKDNDSEKSHRSSSRGTSTASREPVAEAVTRELEMEVIRLKMELACTKAELDEKTLRCVRVIEERDRLSGCVREMEEKMDILTRCNEALTCDENGSRGINVKLIEEMAVLRRERDGFMDDAQMMRQQVDTLSDETRQLKATIQSTKKGKNFLSNDHAASEEANGWMLAAEHARGKARSNSLDKKELLLQLRQKDAENEHLQLNALQAAAERDRLRLKVEKLSRENDQLHMMSDDTGNYTRKSSLLAVNKARVDSAWSSFRFRASGKKENPKTPKTLRTHLEEEESRRV